MMQFSFMCLSQPEQQRMWVYFSESSLLQHMIWEFSFRIVYMYVAVLVTYS